MSYPCRDFVCFLSSVLIPVMDLILPPTEMWCTNQTSQSGTIALTAPLYVSQENMRNGNFSMVSQQWLLTYHASNFAAKDPGIIPQKAHCPQMHLLSALLRLQRNGVAVIS
jgi:hypothetical protein